MWRWRYAVWIGRLFYEALNLIFLRVFACFDSLKLTRSTRNIHTMMDMTNLKLCLTITKGWLLRNVNSHFNVATLSSYYPASWSVNFRVHILDQSWLKQSSLLQTLYFCNALSSPRPVYFFCIPNTIAQLENRKWFCEILYTMQYSETSVQ